LNYSKINIFNSHSAKNRGKYWLKNIFLSQYRNILRKNVVCDMGQRMTPSVNFINILRACFMNKSAYFCQNITREKLCKALSYKKRARKMLMKLTPDDILGYAQS